MSLQTKKTQKHMRTLRRYWVISGVVAVIAVLAMFGGALATQSLTDEDTSELTIGDVNIPFLLRDMQFEAKQSERDVAQIDAAFKKTLSAVKNTNFTCSALTDVLNERMVFDSFSKKIVTLTDKSPKSEIAQAYSYYSAIRGTPFVMGTRGKLYGGEVDPQTRIKNAGTLNELYTCQNIASHVEKTCAVYLTTLEEKKRASRKTTDLYTSVLIELESRCLQPNSIMKKNQLTLNDITLAKSADQLFGASTVLRKLQRVQKKAQLMQFIGKRNSLLTMVEHLLD